MNALAAQIGGTWFQRPDMQVFTDGKFRVDKGELFPFICPKCRWPIPYRNDVAMVVCSHCHHSGFADDFTKVGIAFVKNPDAPVPQLSLPLRFALWLKWFYIDKQVNKFGIWCRLTVYPVMYPIIRLLLWATKK